MIAGSQLNHRKTLKHGMVFLKIILMKFYLNYKDINHLLLESEFLSSTELCSFSARTISCWQLWVSERKRKYNNPRIRGRSNSNRLLSLLLHVTQSINTYPADIQSSLTRSLLTMIQLSWSTALLKLRLNICFLFLILWFWYKLTKRGSVFFLNQNDYNQRPYKERRNYLKGGYHSRGQV